MDTCPGPDIRREKCVVSKRVCVKEGDVLGQKVFPDFFMNRVVCVVTGGYESREKGAVDCI